MTSDRENFLGSEAHLKFEGCADPAFHGPPPRNNESVHFGERPANPNVIAMGDDEDGGFEEVLDLCRGAVQGSTLFGPRAQSNQTKKLSDRDYVT